MGRNPCRFRQKVKFRTNVASMCKLGFDIHPRFQEKLLPIKLQGLNPDRMYRVEEINLMPSASSLKDNGKVYSGDYLMKVGLEVFGFASTQSHVIELTAQ